MKRRSGRHACDRDHVMPLEPVRARPPRIGWARLLDGVLDELVVADSGIRAVRAGSTRRRLQRATQCRERHTEALCQLEVCRVVDGQAVSAREGQDLEFLRRRVDRDPQPRDLSEQRSLVGFGEPPPALVVGKRVAHLEPPWGGGNRVIRAQTRERGLGGVRFVLGERPGQCDRRVEHEGHVSTGVPRGAMPGVRRPTCRRSDFAKPAGS